ncbi:MAG: hypothetical protein ABI673_05455 [Novosphingobium sp.]
MTDVADRFRQDCALRKEARALLDARYGRIKSALTAGNLGEKVKDQALISAKKVAIEATEVANDSRGVIIGTAALLLGWAFRKPIMAKVGQWWPALTAETQGIGARLSRITDAGARLSGGLFSKGDAK